MKGRHGEELTPCLRVLESPRHMEYSYSCFSKLSAAPQVWHFLGLQRPSLVSPHSLHLNTAMSYSVQGSRFKVQGLFYILHSTFYVLNSALTASPTKAHCVNLNAMNFKAVRFIGQFQKRGFRGYVKVTYLLTGSAERMGVLADVRIEV